MKQLLPDIFTFLVGWGEGKTEGNAIDNAKIKMGINFNLLRVSSILPSGARFIKPELFLNMVSSDAIVPSVIAIETSNEKLISAGIGVGIPDSPSFGVIMEYHGNEPREKVKKIIEEMIEESFIVRKMRIEEKKIQVIDRIPNRQWTCVLAVCPLWFSKD